MSKRLSSWSGPAIAFLAAAFVAILAGPSIGAMGMLRTLQGATDFKPECAGGVQGGPQVGQARSNWRASEAPVRYSNGQNMMSITEMESAGFAGWSHRRALSGLYSDNLGYGWKLTGLMQLVQSGGQINVIDGATSVRSFLDNGNGTYTPLVWYQDTLVSDAVNHLLTLTDVEGNRWVFFDFSGLASGGPPGGLKQTVDRTGNLTTTIYGSSGVTLNKILELQQADPSAPTTFQKFVYAYNLSGVAAGLLASVTHQRSVGGVTTTVRKVDYAYYLAGGPNGPAQSIQWARVGDGTTTLDTYYHRYDPSFFRLSLLLGPTAYERAKVALGSEAAIDAASDATLGTYADYVFTYGGLGADGVPYVSQETVQGRGCGCGSSGSRGTYTFSFAESTHGAPPGPNVWSRKAVETLPDGNQNIVYMNQNGHAMLEIFKNVTSGLQWMTYHVYDAQSRQILSAMPSAVTGSVDESNPALLTSANLQDNQGLFHLYDFYSATDLPNGAVAGYRSGHRIRQGELGTPVPASQIKYTSHTDADGKTVYLPLSMTLYRNFDGTGPMTTSFTYTFQGTSNQMLERKTIYPLVPTNQNGSGVATETREQFDAFGRLIWFMNQEGFIDATEYEPLTGATTKRISDVNTSLVANEPPTWVTPPGGGAHQVTTFEVDFLGRVIAVTDPLSHTTYTVFRDAQKEIRTYNSWNPAGLPPGPTGPTLVSREDRAGSYGETLTMSATPSLTGGRPDGTEPISGLQSLQRTYLDTGDRAAYSDSYFNLVGLVYSTAPNIGTLNVHYYRSNFNYDVRGRRDRNQDLTGTIQRTVFDSRGRAISVWIGTDDTPTTGDWSPTNTAGTNLIKTQEYQYDGGGVGDGNVTLTRMFTSASTWLDTVSAYDYQNQLTVSRGPDGVAILNTYDNMGRVTVRETFADADLNLVLSGPELRGKTETSYDERGSVWKTIRHNVDPVSGAVGNRMTKLYWYSPRASLVKVQDANGLLMKSQFDSLGRPRVSYVSYDSSEVTYAQALAVDGDNVIEEEVFDYDAAGNGIQETRYQRTMNPAVPTGDLAAGWSAANSRRTFVAYWYDLGNRRISRTDFGDNGGVDLVRPPTPPAPNSSPDSISVKFDFNAAGLGHRMTDNLGKITETTYDALQRIVKVVENYVDGIATETELDTDRTTETVYDSAARVSKRIAYNPKGAGLGVEQQVTQYAYGTVANQATPAVYRNDVLAAVLYPDSDDTYNPAGAPGAQLANGADAVFDRLENTYDYAGRLSTVKDQRGVVHTMAYDAAGRLLSDAATTVPSGVDGAVLRIEQGYDDLSRPITATSYNAVSAGTVVNQIRTAYDGWGSTVKIEQAHVGSVVVGTPSFQATFAEGAVGGEAKYARVSGVTYPNGRGVNVEYPGTIDDKLSRVARLAHSTGAPIYAEYTYWGTGSLVQTNRPEISTGLTLNYLDATGTLVGWDRFGRISDQKWGSTADGAQFERLQHTYDGASRKLTSDRTYTAAPTNRDEQYSYDGLHRLRNMKRGALSGGTIADASSTFQVDWNELDARGNWRTWRRDSNGGVPAWSTQARKHNKANEIDVDNNDANAAGASLTQTSGSGMNWVDPTYDKAGSMKIAPRPGAETTASQKLTLTHDAWNRLVIVKTGNSGGTTLAEYQYDGTHQRIVKLKPNGANWDRTDYFYNGSGQVLEERTATALPSKTTVATVPKFQWVWDARYIDAPVLRDQNKDGDGDCIDGTDERLYFLNDANFNTTALVTKTGTVVERYAYEPYGAVSIFTAAWATQASTVYSNEILFAGYRLDPESGLYHVRRRAYHPTLGRFVQRDPAGYHDGMNLYEYVGSDPISATDPSGLWGVSRVEWFRPSPVTSWDNRTVFKIHWWAWWAWKWWWMNWVFSPPSCNSGQAATPVAAAAEQRELLMYDLFDNKAAYEVTTASITQWRQDKTHSHYTYDSGQEAGANDIGSATKDGVFLYLKNMVGAPDVEAAGTCVKKLELVSHGSPLSFGKGKFGLAWQLAEDTGKRWAGAEVKWCANAQIFMSGCNTGVTNAKIPAVANQRIDGPISKELSKGFGTKGKVYGLRGYGVSSIYTPFSYLASPGTLKVKKLNAAGVQEYKDSADANGISSYANYLNGAAVPDKNGANIATDP